MTVIHRVIGSQNTKVMILTLVQRLLIMKLEQIDLGEKLVFGTIENARVI